MNCQGFFVLNQIHCARMMLLPKTAMGRDALWTFLFISWSRIQKLSGWFDRDFQFGQNRRQKVIEEFVEIFLTFLWMMLHYIYGWFKYLCANGYNKSLDNLVVYIIFRALLNYLFLLTHQLIKGLLFLVQSPGSTWAGFSSKWINSNFGPSSTCTEGGSWNVSSVTLRFCILSLYFFLNETNVIFWV